MQFYRPHGLLAGFHADRPEPAVPELQFLGEQWLPVNREIGWHQHEVWEFYQQLDGETRWRSHSARYHLGPGNFFAAARRSREAPWASHQPPSTSRSMWNWAAHFSPICLQPGSTATGRVRSLWR